jgi:hypothetical protein
MSAGAVMTYMLAANAETGAPEPWGEFPHCAPWHLLPGAARCISGAVVVDAEGKSDVECTREVGHTGPHVMHLRAGVPLVAWLER